MTVIHTLANILEPWKSLYSDSKVVASAVTAVHLIGLLFGGGLAIAADRSTLRALKLDESERGDALADLHAVHRPVLIALAMLFLSGVALAAADIETFAKSPIFIVKLALVALLLTNGAVLERTERALRTDPADARRRMLRWRRLRTTAYLSLALWTCTLLAGTILVNAA